MTRAARELHVSQPALSKQIRALERQVGAELFRRLPHGVELTPAGEALLPLPERRAERADWMERHGRSARSLRSTYRSSKRPRAVRRRDR